MVTVRELTFADVRDWLRRREILKSRDVIHALAFEDFGIDDLAEMSDATTEEMEACAVRTQAADRSLQGAEPAFFRTRAALAQAARATLANAAQQTLDRSACILVTHGHTGYGVTRERISRRCCAGK